jgi:phospholipid-translocating ATPase
MLGYSTIYTTLPVFSLVFDEDVDEKTALKYPPLYKSLQLGRSLNYKTFLVWSFKSLYQVTHIINNNFKINLNIAQSELP